MRLMALTGAILMAAGSAVAAAGTTFSAAGAFCNGLPRQWTAGSVTLSDVVKRAQSASSFDSKKTAPVDKGWGDKLEVAAFGLG
ncbi:MAG: hypothetical protein C0608_08140 [Deltaproteobacteria bacterium]|nr:MAG: hypothetical protein C0608_08140 [Deltaproteobacteria bacterium]